MRARVSTGASLLAGLVVLLIAAAPAAAQTGEIQGTVTDQSSALPIRGVQVVVVGTQLGAVTGEDGTYRIVGVPEGVHSVRARMIGRTPARRDNVRVLASTPATVDFEMGVSPLTLESIITTGVVDPIEGVKVPFSVGTVTKEQMPVPTTHSALASIQGKVAGATIVRGSGQPGAGVSILLRTPTSITRSNSPLIVVDGVVIGRSFGNTTSDIESLDIERIEVIKGAAAAALYGSRAASGVISITTSRGTDLAQGRTLLTYRTEYGYSELPKGVPLASHHHYLTDDQGRFLDANGEVITSISQSRVTAPDRMLDNPYVGPLYDNINAFFRPGVFATNQLSLAHNTASSNFTLSANHYREKGTIITNDGYQRLNVRVNLDHRMNDDLNVSVTAYHNRARQDELSGSPFWDALMFEPFVNLAAKDEHGNYLQQPDPLATRENPIWRQTSRDNNEQRARTLFNITSRWSPMSWLSFDGSFSYDRSDITHQIYVPKGVPVLSSSDDDLTTDGRLAKEEEYTDAINGAVSANALWTVGDLTARATVRGLMERETYNSFEADARNFWVRDVESLDVGQTQFVGSYWQEIRASGYFLQTGLDYAGKYIADFLVRRDGSSLFGPDERWHTYYRASAAYRMAEEPWWPFEAVTEFKPRFSLGTAGGRPNFRDQYETWSISSTGSISKGTLGNRRLKPELTTETEVGLDIMALDRYQLQLTYAKQTTENQLIQIPQPGVTGYSNQWQNAGTITGNTYEATLTALLLQTPDVSWSTTLLADRSRSEITDWRRVCYFNNLALRCLGSNLTAMYGDRLPRAMSELPDWMQPYADQFQVNDDGYVVWVGEGGDWRQGRWGEEVELNDITFAWGEPFVLRDETGSAIVSKIGEGNPDVSFGWINQFRWRNVSLHTQMHAQLGGDVYNATKQRLYQHFRHRDLDQAGKAEETKKPIDYYQTIYNTANITSAFVEDASFIKLREVALRYTLNQNLLSRVGLGRVGADRIALGLIGRNLFTITDYTGYDPEVGSVFTRIDSFAWPNTRTITANFEIQF